MQVEGVTVTRIIEPKLLGVHKTYNVYICHGKYGEYLRYNSVNYSIPEWAKMENLNEMFNLTHAIKILDWKIMNKVPRGEAGCNDGILGEFNGQTVTLMFRDKGQCRFLRYNNENYYLDKKKNLDNFTLEDAIKTFGWDRKKM